MIINYVEGADSDIRIMAECQLLYGLKIIQGAFEQSCQDAGVFPIMAGSLLLRNGSREAHPVSITKNTNVNNFISHLSCLVTEKT